MGAHTAEICQSLQFRGGEGGTKQCWGENLEDPNCTPNML